mmetsp:Transcript_169010/g.410759  ORF Transcript_169010/g.410759 Transcript_169010/m.410759 type:complete len:216 (+) Transcript_169010:254-901(+)
MRLQLIGERPPANTAKLLRLSGSSPGELASEPAEAARRTGDGSGSSPGRSSPASVPCTGAPRPLGEQPLAQPPSTMCRATLQALPGQVRMRAVCRAPRALRAAAPAAASPKGRVLGNCEAPARTSFLSTAPAEPGGCDMRFSMVTGRRGFLGTQGGPLGVLPSPSGKFSLSSCDMAGRRQPPRLPGRRKRPPTAGGRPGGPPLAPPPWPPVPKGA